MKLHKILNISAGVALVLGATACSGDYLDLKPEGTLQYEEVLPNEEGADLAVIGMGAAMYKQYAGISDGSTGFNGEPSILQYYGEVVGQDYVSIYWQLMGQSNLLNWGDNGTSDMNNSGGSQPAWGYCYNLISMANNLLTYTPKKLDDEGNVMEDPKYNFNPIPDVEGRHAFRYAQALTFRAHAYIKLMQIYCARYEDRFTTSGEWTLTVPLRLKYESPEGNVSCPLATWEELMNQIYADLGQAISLYETSNAQRSEVWEPDINVAKGLFARIAMINHDWSTARQMASEARADYPIMESKDYWDGFAKPNSEWMWTNSGEAQGLYFYSFGALYACNGAYPCRWGTIGAGGIDNDLVKQGSPDDMRVQLFFSPINLPSYRSLFWSTSNVDSGTMDINAYSNDLHRQFVNFARNRYKVVSDYGWYPPYTYYGYPLDEVTTSVVAPFGAQFKFWGTDGYSTSYYPFMRGSEMLLIEAEAAYELGDEKAADNLLRELNMKRFEIDERYGESTYDYSYSGEALKNAIRYYRRIELWGEGFSWFDFKRWNIPIVRSRWIDKNTDSGNWPDSFAGTIGTDVANGWRWRIPLVEINYNEALWDMRTTLGYGYDW